MDKDFLIKLILSVSGVMLGAILAFIFNRILKKMDTISEQKAKCRLAAYILYRQYESVTHYFEDYIAPYGEHPNRESSMLPVKFSNDVASVDITDISFLLSTDDPNTLHGIACLQDRYKTIKDILDDRYDLHMKIQEKMGNSWKPEDLGEYDSIHLKVMTDAIFEHIPEFIEAYFISKTRFENQYKKIFKENGPLIYADQPKN